MFLWIFLILQKKLLHLDFNRDMMKAPGTLQGEGIFVDDFRIFKNSGGNFPAPFNLTGESQSESVNLTWSDMNASGTDDFAFDNDGC